MRVHASEGDCLPRETCLVLQLVQWTGRKKESKHDIRLYRLCLEIKTNACLHLHFLRGLACVAFQSLLRQRLPL